MTRTGQILGMLRREARGVLAEGSAREYTRYIYAFSILCLFHGAFALCRSKRSSEGGPVTRSKATILAGIVLLLALFAWPGVAWAVVTERASVDSSEVQGASDSSEPSISSDGRYVAFVSNSAGLVAYDTNGVADVFVRDRQTGETTRVSVGTGGTEATGGPSSHPSISADGRYVAFQSDASNLVTGDTNARRDVFVHDRVAGTTVRASVNSSGVQGNHTSEHPFISSDGNYVAFHSYADNLVANDTNIMTDVFVRDRVAGTTERVSVDSAETQASGGSYYPSISSDGSYVAFDSGANNLVANDTNGTTDVFVRDRTAGTTKRVSVATGGTQGDGESYMPAISGDGRYIAFPSHATNLVANDTNVKCDIFVYDQTPGTTTRVSVSGAGAQADGHSYLCSISDNGRYVAFESAAANLVSGDTGDIYDVFVRDRTAGTTRRVSVAPDGTQANDQSDTAVISGDGNYVAFKSFASNLVSDDTNSVPDIFVDVAGTRYEQTDSHLVYVGTWSTATTASASGGSFKYASSSGSSTIVSFDGTHLAWLATTGPSYGIAEVSLDGGAAELVDLYSASTRYQERVYRTDLLSAGAHTLTIEWSGTKNSASSGYAIGADAFEVLGTLAQAIAPTRYQQDNANFEFPGTWSTGSTWSASGGSFTYTNAPGSAVSVTFDGTYLDWFATTGPGYGKAQVTLDAGEPGEVTTTVDLYSSYTKYKQRVYGTGFLEDGAHTLSIYWIGQKNYYATGTTIDVDAFDVLGTLSSAPEPPPILWRYQQTESKLTYLGNWSTGSSWSASGGSFCSAGATGDAILVRFTGTEVKLYAKTGPWYGQATVTLDGSEETVEFYSPTTLYKQVVYAKTGLTYGDHNLTIKCAGTKILASGGYAVSLDALDINGYLTQALAPTRIQQDNAALEYTGTWSTSSTWSASGGSFVYANSAGSALNVAFQGTYLAWYATAGPGYGKAQVTLDEGAPGEVTTTVDLYSSYTKYKQRVFNTGLLSSGTHTLSIYWIGQKNAAASGTTVSADAFDTLGDFLDAPPPPPILWRYQQSDSRLTYLGTWSYSSTWSASGGSLNYTGAIGAAVTVDFTGTSVKLLCTTGPGYGKAQVNLDGSYESMDLYSPGTLYKQPVYEKTGLSDGPHTLSIKCALDKNPSSSGYSINLDALDITGYVTQATVPTRYQQDHSSFSYTGGSGWSTATTWSASGGSFKYANSLGSMATFYFNGTYVAWLATTGPGYGKAAVSVDGAPGVIVDLYSPTTKYKQRVYDTGLLVYGTHAVVIEWYNEKNPASSGYTIDVDAVDLLGTPN
jgi:Tol biopolymer transport system component